MKFVNPLPFVSDILRATKFYRDVLGLSVLRDHGNFVEFENGFALHEGKSLYRTIFGLEMTTVASFGRQNLVLYFEVEDVDDTFGQIADQLNLIHKVKKQEWGQKVFRFYDPDGHIVEIGEPQSIA